MKNRVNPDRKARSERVGWIIVCTLCVAVACALGYRLDWSGLGLMSAAPSGKGTPSADAREAAPGLAKAAAGEGGQEWAPDAAQEAWDDMTQELSWLVSRHRGRVAIYLEDLKSGRTWSYHPDEMYPSASLIKVPIMACVFYKIHDGEMSLKNVLTLRRHNRVGGSGSLKWQPDGSKFTVRELLQHMISESDNTATAMLLEAVGLGYAQRQFPKMGLICTGIYQEGLSLRAGKVAHENFTTASEMTMLLAKIYRGELVDPAASRLMLDILRHKKAVASRLAKGLPRGWEIAHKTGLLRQACHDAAVFFSPRGDYAMTVLTGQNGNYKAAKAFISRLGQVTFRHYGAGESYLARAPVKGRRSRQVALR